MPEEGVNPVTLPDAASTVWEWFMKLNQSRQVGMSGPMAVNSAEIVAFFALEGAWPALWELNTIRALDSMTLRLSYDLSEKKA